MGDRIGAIRLPVQRLHIELTNSCNFSCEFCPDARMRRPRGSMDFSVLKKILDEAARDNLASTVFFHVMGEPLLYPRFKEALEYSRAKGINVCVTTNGSLLTEESVEEIAGAGAKSMILSLQTPDEESFRHRGARGIGFIEYSERVRNIARKVMKDGGMDLRICFLSSPLRRLIFPVMPDISIADTTKTLKGHLLRWAEYILKGSEYEGNLREVRKSLWLVSSFKNNSVPIGPGVTFDTRIMGDWAVHSIEDGVKARIGYCPAIQENFGILWNGDVVFCCVDYEGKTSVGNVVEKSLAECLASPHMQKAIRGFNRLRILHPHCQRCIGDKNLLNAVVRQIGSIVYFKGYRKLFNHTGSAQAG